MPYIPYLAVAAAILMLSAATSHAAPLSPSLTNSRAGNSIAQIHLKPGNHCHPHGHGKLCHGAGDYPALHPRADREPHTSHRHTRL